LAIASTSADTCKLPCWEQVNFTTPVSINAHTQYVATYYDSNGYYAGDNYGLTSNMTNGPLTALSNNSSGGNGVYHYGAGIAFPTSSWNASNYYVDVVFSPASPPQQTIASVSMSNNSFVGGSPSGTTVGSVGVAMSPTSRAFSGSLSLSGADAASFQLVGTTLETNGVVPAGTYNVTIIASQIGISNSPFSQSKTITAKPPPTLNLTVNPSSPTVSSNAELGAVVTTLTATWSDNSPFAGSYGFTTPYGDDSGRFAISGNQVITHNDLSGLAGTVQEITVEAVQATAASAQPVFSPPSNVDITITNATQTITAISLSSNSFTGGAADSTTIGSITVTLSPASPPFSGSLALTGTDRGSGNDKDSFRISGPELQTNTAGGATDQPGTYSINIVATGSYTNSGYSQPYTITATGPGGDGWQLAFSDEFTHSVVNWQNPQSITSITWATGAGVCAPGCGTVVLPSHGSGITVAGQTVSISGATNSGSGGNSAINNNFQVSSVTDDEHLVLYMPAAGGVFGSIGVGSATLGTGPWVAALNRSCGSPCNGLPLIYANDNPGVTEGWGPENLSVDANGLSILTQNTAYTDAAGKTHSTKTGHIQTWNGSAGFAQVVGNGIAFDFYGSPRIDSGTYSGLWASFWALGSDNSWPGTGAGGGEIDVAEFAAYSCTASLYSVNTFGAGGVQGITSRTATYTQNLHQFTATIIGGAVAYYTDGSLITTNPTSGYRPGGTGDGLYPIVDVEYRSSCGANATLPATTRARYVRVYTRVTSGACYSSIPGHTTIPHTGTC
jgi:hypothetical protein